MRKGWMVLLAMALVVALAVPASAEMKLTGFYRTKAWLSNFANYSASQYNTPGSEAVATTSLTKENGVSTNANGRDTARSIAYVEMRNRLRFEIGDENVKGVTFFEIDGAFGDTGGKVGRNQGFAANGDSINLETKNVFVWFKIPDTSVEFTVGLQGYTDEFAGLLFGASDQAGVVAKFKLDPVNFRFTWLKMRENNVFTGTDAYTATRVDPGDKQADYYALDAKFAATKDATVTGHLGFLRDTKAAVTVAEATSASLKSLEVYYIGVNGTVNAGPAAVTGFLLYNTGKFKHTTASALKDVDIAGYAARLRADANAGPGKAFLEALYVSGDDDRTASTSTTKEKYKSVITGSDFDTLTAFYTSTDMLILFPNADVINSATALTLNPNNGGRGVILLAAGYSQKFSDKLSGKLGLGYLTADKKRKVSAALEPKGKTMGTEINANVNYNITKGLDFGVYGAYCMLGSFYDRLSTDAAGLTKNPDDLYDMHARLNYAF